MCPINRKEMKIKRQNILIEEKRQGVLRGQVIKARKRRTEYQVHKEQGLDHRLEGVGM